jgi:uncharacterized protein
VKHGRLALAFIIVACYPLAPSAELQSTAPTAAEVRALLQANGTEDVAAQVGPVAAQQLSVALHRANPGLPPSADAVVMDVVVNYVRQQAERDRVADRLIPIYARYLTKADVRRITEFYRSPAGRKLVSAMPAISLESAKVGQQWIESILPGLQSQLVSRLKSEKLIE